MKLLDELAAELSTKTPNKENVTAKLQDIDKRRHEFLELMDSLQTLYGEDKLASLAASTGDEADKMIDRVDNETKKARLFLSQDNIKESEGNNTSQSGTFESAHGKYVHVVDANKPSRADSNPKVFGRQEEYQSWWAVFSSCVNETNLSAQFKMLRLESCLNGEAAETMKGLGYSDHAYEAAKARLNLKENKKFTDLEGGTLYAIMLEKLPQALLSQYYRCIEKKGSMESLEELRHWVGEEAEYTRYKHQQLSMIFPEIEMHEERAQPSLISGPQKRDDRPCKVCNQKHPVWKCDVFKRKEHRKKWETAKKLGLCYRCLGKGHLGD